jgi:hypothetical protein
MRVEFLERLDDLILLKFEALYFNIFNLEVLIIWLLFHRFLLLVPSNYINYNNFKIIFLLLYRQFQKIRYRLPFQKHKLAEKDLVQANQVQ